MLTGTNDLADPEGVETYVSDIIVNEAYEYGDNQENDIALLKVSL